MQTYKLTTVLKEEKAMLTERRRRLFGEEAAAKFDENKFGIAMSGGGIRSATINLGFLRTLNLFKILEKADYLSTVSGGGYTGAYIQATVKEKNGYDELFDDNKIHHLRMYGNYFIPGQGKWEQIWNAIVLAVGYLISWAMSLLSLAITLVIISMLFRSAASLPFLNLDEALFEWDRLMAFFMPGVWVLCSIVAVHFFSNLLFNFDLNISKFFNQVEAVLALALLLFLGVAAALNMDTSIVWQGSRVGTLLLVAAGLYLSGFFLNPNSLSFHRYYRKQLADAFLSHTVTRYKNLLLKDVFTLRDNTFPENQGYLAPYALINTCLNLQNPGGEDKFKGAKASDYFLLSAAFCGSKLSNYVKTAEFPGYRHMTLPAALTISAAAVNPGMGIYSNKLLSVMMTLFNARWGFWVNNPLSQKRPFLPGWATYMVWWPNYFFKELFSKIGTTNRKLNISDGGHIENLAVYELLRRGCRLIIAVDAGADPLSTFADLENLSIRARNELGIAIVFRNGQDPVDIIRPRASSGYSQKRFSIADLYKIWEEFELKYDSGNPVMYKKKIKENGQTVEREFKLEALVNYFYSRENTNVLKFRVDLKAERGIDILEGEYDRLQKIAEDMVRKNLAGIKDKNGSDKIKVGTLVYIKSSVTAPRKLFVPEFDDRGDKNLQFDTFKYKIYHPEFPHEPTADQFFDPVQWESYYQLGQFIATDILDTPRPPNHYRRGDHDVSIDELIDLFDNDRSLFKKEERLEGIVDASSVPAVVADEAELEIARPKERGAATAVPEQAPAPAPKPVQEAAVDEMQFKI
ncbi:MAG: hypothetical protein R2830_12255 [Saprospiraceae bacterium]